MRIAFIGQKSFVMGDRGGGIEKHVAELAPRLVRLGHDVTIYARTKYSEDRARYYEGIRIRYIPTIYTKHLEAIIHVFLSTVDVIMRRVDVVHYHGVGPSLLSFLPRILRRRVTVIATFHAQDQYHQKWGIIARAVLRIGELATLKFPHAAITVSHGLQVISREKYGAEAIFIPNGAVAKNIKLQTFIKAEGLARKKYILFVGRLLPVKGVHHLIRAYREVKSTMSLVIIGGAAKGEESYLERLNQLAKGDNRIQLLGFRTPNEVEQFYAHAYLYCQPSESEGLPVSVIEAMGHGTAVLVSDIPGNLEAIHQSGFTFENKNVEDLRAQLQHLIKHSDQVRSASRDVKKTVDRYFDWDRIAEQTLQVYRSARH
jgi:glycosyltransferase involved in cell wall biosynthesis